ncbi:MAG: mandelate racemase/muconate lactonizing enzyme family protein [Nitrososphaeria archaeon]|jgi:L-alanine-DL-glutamate epimerase-like enolase superfamily enzyme
MKITNIEPILCDGGFRPWTFVKVSTDEGIIGYGDCTDWGKALTVAEEVKQLGQTVIGEDPNNIEKLWWKMYNQNIRAIGGIAHKALAGIDIALWDIKGKSLGVPVYELLGGRFHSQLRLYWTHCGWTRFLFNEVIGKPKLNTKEDIAKLGKEVVQRGYTGLKTNILDLHGTGRSRQIGGQIDNQIIQDAIDIVGTFRESVGENLDIMLDVACMFNETSAIKLARALEPYNLLWLEEPVPIEDAGTCKTVRMSTKTPICMSEGLYQAVQFKPFLDLHAIDVAMLDIPWNGITGGKKIANLCEMYYMPVAPHNCHSPLATFINAHLCATLSNFLILELDVDDVPWRDEVVSEPIKVNNGYLELPTKPGFGVDLNEDEIAKHPFRWIPGIV